MRVGLDRCNAAHSAVSAVLEQSYCVTSVPKHQCVHVRTAPPQSGVQAAQVLLHPPVTKTASELGQRGTWADALVRLSK